MAHNEQLLPVGIICNAACVAEKGTEKAAPANPFLRFCQDQRPLVKAEHPGLMLGQVSLPV